MPLFALPSANIEKIKIGRRALMKIKQFCIPAFFIAVLGTTFTFTQTIPDDPNHLPTKIGGEPKGNIRVDSIMVTGKIRLEGFPSDQVRPAIYVAAYGKGRFVGRRQASESGSYSINDVPREGATIVVEIYHNEVASREISITPASIMYQDFSVNWSQFAGAKDKVGVISVAGAYDRSRENQDQFERAVSEIKRGSNDSAISALKAVVGSDPKDYYAWTQLGNAYFLKKDNKNAEAAYLQAISEYPAYTLASVNLGKLYLSQNDNDKAIEVLTKAVESDPMSADAQQYLGEAYLAIKKGSKAVGYLNEAIRLAPIEKAEIHLRLATLYNGAGLKPRASAEYQKFLEKVPNYEKRDDLKKYISENPPPQ